MSTVISPEITMNSPFWIPKQRYYELKHFCLQYPNWKMQLKLIDGYQHQAEYTDIPKTITNDILDPVARVAGERERVLRWVSIVEKAAELAGADLAKYILKGITEGVSYSILVMKMPVPCNRNEFYDRYRKFFWVLDKLRD